MPFQKTLEKLYDIPIVGDIRGAGFFWGIEMVKNRETRESFNSDESEQLLRGFLSKALFDNGLCAATLHNRRHVLLVTMCCGRYCRADDRGDPVIQLAPPLICTQEHFNEIEVHSPHTTSSSATTSSSKSTSAARRSLCLPS